MTVLCSDCGAEYARRPELIGRQVKCRRCGHVFGISPVPHDVAAAYHEPLLAADDRPLPRSTPALDTSIYLPPKPVPRPLVDAMAPIEADAVPPPLPKVNGRATLGTTYGAVLGVFFTFLFAGVLGFSAYLVVRSSSAVREEPPSLVRGTPRPSAALAHPVRSDASVDTGTPAGAPGTSVTEPVAGPDERAGDPAIADQAWAPLRGRVEEAVTIRPIALEDNLRIAEDAVAASAQARSAEQSPRRSTGSPPADAAVPLAGKGLVGGIPSTAALIDDALGGLKKPDPAAQAVALQLLIDLKPNERRNEIADAVESIIVDKDTTLLNESADVLQTWWGPRTAIRLLALLDPDVAAAPRRAGMRVLAATKDRRAVRPIARWLLKDPDAATAALTAMGPVAEEDTIKLLREREPVARRLAAKVLAEVGTGRSIQPLSRAARDNRDPAAAAVAARAVEAVKDRMARR